MKPIEQDLLRSLSSSERRSGLQLALSIKEKRERRREEKTEVDEAHLHAILEMFEEEGWIKTWPRTDVAPKQRAKRGDLENFECLLTEKGVQVRRKETGQQDDEPL